MSEEVKVVKVDTKGSISIRKAIRALGLLALIFVFCPSFMVSCSGETVKINGLKALTGVEFMGEHVEKSSHPLLALVLILVPVLIMVLTFLKNKTDKTVGGYILCATFVDLAAWFRFKNVTEKFAEENMCDFETTGWYSVNLIVLLAVMVLGIMVLAGVKKLDNGQVEAVVEGGVQPAEAQAEAQTEAPTVCPQCGAKIEKGAAFCGACGAKIE